MANLVSEPSMDHALLDHVPDRPFPTYDSLSYDQYLRDHLLPNTPFLLSSACTASWRARREWALPAPDGPSQPNLGALRQYAHHVVPVANTLKQEYSEFERTERELREVLDLWERGQGARLYVKDWHLMAEIEKGEGGVGEVYEVPECLRDDWLNPPYTPRLRIRSSTSEADCAALCEDPDHNSDFRFTYLGPAGTFTPLHRDVYASYSWSANVVGRKVWWLFPPDRLEGAKRGGEPVFDVRRLPEEGGGIKVLQQEGEVIFVPSGWYHQVMNVDFCISINHNFFSSPTLPRIFTALEEAQVRVEAAISDVKEMIQGRLGVGLDDDGLPLWEREWVDEVQALLERDAGWGWKGFWECVKRNCESPPAEAAFSSARGFRDGFVRDIMERYKGRREWVILQSARSVIEEVESLVKG